MSVLSANTLFHFTGKDALINILGTGFRPTYCKEFGTDSIGDALQETLIPMVCFCDIPLSKLDKHINGHSWEYEGNTYESKSYGSYGLGMSKDWGRANRLSPVTYVTPESYLLEYAGISANTLYRLYLEYEDRWTKDKSPDVIKNYFNNPVTRAMAIGMPPMPDNFHTFDELQIALSNALALFGYMKPYQDATTGQLYYNEREWRITVPYPRRYRGDVPILRKYNDRFVPVIGAKEDVMYDIDTYKKIIVANYMVHFHPTDIKYIIVKNDNDIEDIINRLREFPKVYPDQAIGRLTSRILTCEQLHEDF